MYAHLFVLAVVDLSKKVVAVAQNRTVDHHVLTIECNYFYASKRI